MNGSMRLGAVQSFIQYLKDFNRPMNVIAQVISNLQMAVASYDRINELTMLLNYYRDQYYNYAKSEISDYEYDNLYDELKKLEDETGYRLANSPTQSVGYIVKSELIKVKHNHPMLSLDKRLEVRVLQVKI